MNEMMPVWWLGFVGLLVLVALGIFWYRAKPKLINKLLTLLMWFVLLLLGWRSTQQDGNHGDVALILTEGSDLETVSQILKKLPESTSIFALPESGTFAGLAQQKKGVPDVGWLVRNLPPRTAWHITGWGFSPEELDFTADREIQFHPNEAPLGVSDGYWPTRLELGKDFSFQGRFNRPLPETWRVSLWAPSGKMVAEKMVSADSLAFQLVDRPVTTGLLTYQVRILDGNGDIQAEEKLPVQITGPRALNVWCLLGSPRFEIKFLKRYLGETGTAMLIRTRLTDEDWHQESINRDPVNKPIRALPWHEADVLIADGSALAALDKRALTAISHAVNDGMGFMLMPDNLEAFRQALPASMRDFFCDWNLQFEEEGIEQLQARLRWRGTFPTPATKVEVFPATIQLKTNQQVLADDGFGGVMAASSSRGNGVVATSLVRQSQTWIMRGAETDFQSYWAHMLSRISRPVKPQPNLVVSQPAWVHQPKTLKVWADSAAGLKIHDPQSRKHLDWETDALQFGRRQAQFMPEFPGWHRASWDDQELHAFYVNDREAWKTIQATTKLDAMNRHLREPTLENRGMEWKFPWEFLTVGLLLWVMMVLWLGEKLQRL